MDPRIREAQGSVIDPARRVCAGPDTDTLLALEERYDGCHFSKLGQERLAELGCARSTCDRCWWPDSNGRPTDYESVALPAELHQQIAPSAHYSRRAIVHAPRLR